MLDFDTATDLLKQYGYSSTTSHPYLYQNEDSIGICYVYNDEEYGTLERVKTFKTLEDFEEFLKELEWIKTNGVSRNVRMILDNYEAMAPKVMYLRNEKLMVENEMYEIDNFDFREQQRDMMDDVSKVIYEAGDLLLVYDEIKKRQLDYLQNIIKLKNSLRQKYYDLQKEVDEYNHNKVEREIILLPEIADSGINETLEIALKDKYNMYIAELPTYSEACDFLKEVWDLSKQLELNLKYYDAIKEENDTLNELKIVNQKLELMNKLNDEGRPLFGIDLGGQFRKINKICMSESTSISDEYIHKEAENIERKYSVFDNLDILNTSDYLREAIQNSNYDDLAIKYTRNLVAGSGKPKLPLNEIVANLSTQYSSSLTNVEQSILILYNNHEFRTICDAILKVEGFETLPIKKLISIISKTKGYSKVKSIIYDNVKKRLNDPCNDSVRNSLFSQYDFTSYETFITSIVNSLVQLKSINNKMVLVEDINMYSVVDKVDEIKNSKFINVTKALNDLLSKTKDTSSMIGIVLLKKGTPVLYSPYYLDIGDVYSKGASLQMAIKEMSDFELLVDCSDILVAINPKETNVARYYSTPKTVGDISVVSDIKLSFKTTFCKVAFTSNLGVDGKAVVQANQTVEMPQEKVPASEVKPVQGEQEVKENVPVPSVPTQQVKEATPIPSTQVQPKTPTPISVQPQVKKVEPVKEEKPVVEQPKVTSNQVTPSASVKQNVNTGDVKVNPLVKEKENITDNKQSVALPVKTLDKQGSVGTPVVKKQEPVSNVSKPVVKENTNNVKPEVKVVNNISKPVTNEDKGKVPVSTQQVNSTQKVIVKKNDTNGSLVKNVTMVSKPVNGTQGNKPVVNKVNVINKDVTGKVPGRQLIKKDDVTKVEENKPEVKEKVVVKTIQKPVTPSTSNPQKKQVVVGKIGTAFKPSEQVKQVQNNNRSDINEKN